jgi:hypothetical protein
MTTKPDPKPTSPAALSNYSYAVGNYGTASEILVKADHLDAEAMIQAATAILPVTKDYLPQDLHADHDWIWGKLSSAVAEKGQGTLRPSCEAMDSNTMSQVEDRIQAIYASLKNRADSAARR